MLTSTSGAEMGTFFLNIHKKHIHHLTLEELGHPQPPTPISCDNETAVGIVNGTVKRQRSRMFEMRYFYCCDQVEKRYFSVMWAPGLENLADYPSKHHPPAHHKHVRPIYLHCDNSPRVLERALAPRLRRQQLPKIASPPSRRIPMATSA